MNRLPIRWRPLLALTALVLLVHAWLLRPSPPAFQMSARERPRPLITRTVVAAVPAETAAVVPQAAAANTAAARDMSVAPSRAPAPRPVEGRRPASPAGSRVAVTTVAQTSPASASAQASRTAVAAVAFVIPKPVLLHYKVLAHARGLSLSADSQLRWRQDGSEYEAQLDLSGPLFPKRSQHSTGRITAQGLAPQRFSDKARSEEAAHFQRDEGKISFSSNRPDAALAAGAQDRLSVLMQLGGMIAGKPGNFGPGTTIAVQTASTRDAEVWQFTVEGEERLQLPGGELDALKLIRNPRKEFDQKIELWLAPGMDYVPVRLRLTQPNGDWVDQQWSSTDKG